MPQDDQPLRRGWTTGACAAAAAKAAWAALCHGAFPDPVTILLPRGQAPAFALAEAALLPDGGAMAAVVKDAGDDPDVTHGALVRVRLHRLPPGSGLVFVAGEGVGTVTLPGLPLPPGEPAINPMPRAMIRSALAEVMAAEVMGAAFNEAKITGAEVTGAEIAGGEVVAPKVAGVEVTGVDGSGGAALDLRVEISIPDGERIALRTMNPRLGILGGLSILGTTGVVVPYSCAAWIHSIHRGIDVARATGLVHVAGATGSTSEDAVRAHHALPEQALIDMGDFVGGMLKYLRAHPVPLVTVAGGVAKLTKLAQGRLDLHSRRGAVDLEALAALALEAGGNAALAARIVAANTAAEAFVHATEAGIPLGDAVAARGRAVAEAVVEGSDIAVEVLLFDRQGQLMGHAGPDRNRRR